MGKQCYTIEERSEGLSRKLAHNIVFLSRIKHKVLCECDLPKHWMTYKSSVDASTNECQYMLCEKRKKIKKRKEKEIKK